MIKKWFFYIEKVHKNNTNEYDLIGKRMNYAIFYLVEQKTMYFIICCL